MQNKSMTKNPRGSRKAKSKKSRLKDFASTGSKKAKDVAKFVYKNRKEIMEVIALLGSLLALGKGVTRRGKR
jgi:hypothetical protein